MSDRLRFTDLSLHIDINFWYELERRKLHDWKLETPTVSIKARVPTPSLRGVANTDHIHNLVALDGPCLAANPTPIAGNYQPFDVDLLNYNTMEQLTGMDRKGILAAASSRLVQSVKADTFGSTHLTRAQLFTFADLKTHNFHYCAAFGVCEGSTPVNFASTSLLSECLPKEAGQALFDVMKQNPTLLPQIVSTGCKEATPLTRSSISSVLMGKPSEAFLAMQDLGTSAQFPGWTWRNVLTAVRLAEPTLTKVRLLCIRSSLESSLVVDCCFEPNLDAESLKVVGWTDKKLHKIEMGSMMDPAQLADSSAKLNLSLMKWRMMPDIQLDAIRSTKALLLGSGTLGCNVARHLLMWGVTHITMVDRGQVSFSNPVRQTLFELSDCVAQGQDRVKSIAACKTLKRILPTVNATGVEMTIRMPGHRIDADREAEAKADVEKLDKLIQEHDVVYLLTDSRESRWLPTLLCAAHEKPVINAALGFDSYLVMRHGLEAQGDKRVGCYFCADVVAPMDSLTARTLDQQCTVTRPGVSAMASALAVELLAALKNHKLEFAAPAYVESDESTEETASTVLGILPHQIRGDCREYGSMLLHGPAFSKCTACSPTVVKAYKEQGFAFILRCLNEPLYMEELTGLKADKEAVDNMDWEDDDF